MSSFTPTSTTTTTISSTAVNTPPPPQNTLPSISIGHAIVFALTFLLTLLLVAFICYAITRRRRRYPTPTTTTDNGVILPRIIFVAEEDEEGSSLSSQNEAAGLNEAAINSYPKFAYSLRKNGGGGDSSSLCAICLCEYKDKEMLRMLPDCRHSFHLMCVDAWLKLNASCPVCRNSPLPTPLAELVPLSHYADGWNRRI